MSTQIVARILIKVSGVCVLDAENFIEYVLCICA